ncbi:FGGY-family carbohydrate kinase (plasmid) [Streptomyces sp. BI20]|uniref:FGGY-family carbohydrate kinase n=1 Tax=Streptomyces sp. BI20 TaxID=3403460 RepID=UPI003C74BBC7
MTGSTPARPRYLLGIDNGSQSTKVTVFDEDGRPLASGRTPLRPYDTPRPGVVEHPDDDLWDSIGSASRAALAAFAARGGDPAHIVGVGLCTIRFCRAVLKADGSLAQPVMSWMDARVSRPWEPGNPEAAWVTTSSGYLGARLTGVFADTSANHAGMWPLDAATRRWTKDEEALAACGVPRDMLFELVDPGDVLGRITPEAAAHTGIPVGLPVVATANDKAVEALGCGLRSGSQLLVSLGTYVAGMTVGPCDVPDPKAFWTNHASVPGAWLYESHGVRRGMWTVSWYRDLLGDGVAGEAGAAGLSVEEYLNRGAAEVPAGCEGLITLLDWLAPADKPFRKGALLGFDGRQGRFHVYRSILEALALTVRDAGVAMGEELGTGFEEVVVSGGGAGSDLLMGILADVFGLPARRPELTDAAGLGAAICAAVGTGVHGSFEEAVERMTRTGARFAPDPGRHETYRRLGAIHRDVRRHTDEVHRRTHELFG